ncbi:MAG: proline dehydrogenase family protein [Hymenobacteraceae bacterium]|nr:proline dehydrogenase family protein [Hymenobacteraceae bacterium]
MYGLFAMMNSNFVVKTGGSFVNGALNLRIPGAKWMVKQTVFRQFCGGETIRECRPVIEELAKYGIGTILDYSVEGEGDERAFDATAREILATVAMAAAVGPAKIPFSVFKVTGLADTDLLERAQSGKPITQEQQAALDRGLARVDSICQAAHAAGVRVFVDAEESWIQETIDRWALEMMRRYNRQRTIVYNTYQLYRHDRLAALQADVTQAEAGAENARFHVGAKLVRGAYLEKEIRRAQQQGYANPMNPTKQATDDLYDASIRFCLAHINRVAICAGTHNEASSRLCTELMHQYGLAPSDERVYFAQLYGMSDNLSYNLAAAGYHVAKYVPYGPVEAVMPYLLRRANENTAIAGQSSREFLLIQKELRRRQSVR